ncbi:unnamed protein product [Bursaphelenchus okinawaensis]|uniref:Uncharacterized protein n=1 Tax=Bursaphelenchus okinawaensis TaxID=465554 RepID=A0A811LGW7_9BILA|nr:unnamed protein product [Bursaphelenchus okinawaensis]CAG9122176.1 unnamed protein product [Bursaphelenchus okinawaensis]
MHASISSPSCNLTGLQETALVTLRTPRSQRKFDGDADSTKLVNDNSVGSSSIDLNSFDFVKTPKRRNNRGQQSLRPVKAKQHDHGILLAFNDHITAAPQFSASLRSLSTIQRQHRRFRYSLLYLLY